MGAAWSGGWGPLFERYRALALRLACGIVQRADMAEDAVQEAVRAVLERTSKGEVRCASEAHARNYFLRAVHNHALNLQRVAEQSRARVREVVSDEPGFALGPSPEEREAEVFLAARLGRALASLRPEERELVELRYLQGLTFKEIAARQGASISTLHSRVEAGLDKIRRHLGKEGLRP